MRVVGQEKQGEDELVDSEDYNVKNKIADGDIRVVSPIVTQETSKPENMDPSVGSGNEAESSSGEEKSEVVSSSGEKNQGRNHLQRRNHQMRNHQRRNHLRIPLLNQ